MVFKGFMHVASAPTLLIVFTLVARLHAANPELIAVLDLKTAGEVIQTDVDDICRAISDNLSYDMRYVTFNRDDLPDLLQNLGIDTKKTCAKAACLAKTGKTIGASTVIGGRVERRGKELTLELLRVDVENAQTKKTVSHTSTAGKYEFIHSEIPRIVDDLMSPEKPSTVALSQPKKKRHPLVWIGVSGLAAAGTAAGIVLFGLEGPANDTSPDENLSLDDAPRHVR